SPAVHKNFGQAHSVAFLVSRHRTSVVDNREILPKQIQSVERIQHGNFGVSYQQAWRTREALRQELEGDETEGFKKLPGLVNLIETNNQYNHVHINTNGGYVRRCLI